MILLKKTVILGSTGSIGRQSLDVINNLSQEWEVVALTANTSIDLLEEQAIEYKPEYVVIMDDKLALDLQKRLQGKCEVLKGLKGLEDVVSLQGIDLVINGLVGAAGLKPSIAAIKAGNRLGLANKESMVIGGEIINKLLASTGQEIYPVDSEHNAIFQILSSHRDQEIKKILLTASGGPFLNYSRDELQDVSVKEALAHPKWNMGKKISIDSATMMNKGLEVIEAHWLFNTPYDKIDVVVHPESIIHSLIEFIDNSMVAEMGVSDMRLPIQSAFTYPEKKNAQVEELDLFSLEKLTFYKPDVEKFIALKLAYQAGKMGGSYPVVLNAANEVAVDSFLKEKIKFNEITRVIELLLEDHKGESKLSVDDILAIDQQTRKKTREVLDKCC